MERKHVSLKWSEWEEKFRPIRNPINNPQDLPYYAFETYGDEYDFVKGQIEGNHVWTELYSDGVSAIYSGHYFVNRLVYYVTEVPYEDDTDYEIILSTEVECECYSEDYEHGEYGDPDCQLCEGYGYKTEEAE